MRDVRIENEIELFAEAASTAPARLSPPVRTDQGLRFTLRAAPSLIRPPASLDSQSSPDWSRCIRSEHTVRLSFPRYFPAMPIEAFVEEPVFHPNAHPDTGFLCLWSIHRVAHNALNSIARVVAVLAWQLFNRQPEHVMQPSALGWFDGLYPSVRERMLPLAHIPLPIPYSALPPSPEHWRRRLS